MTPISGKLSDLFGRKSILTVIILIYTIGAILGGFSKDIYFLLFARILQGVGISFFPIAYSIIKDIFPAKKMAIGQGIVTSMFASGAVLGILFGGLIIQNYSWNMTFYSLIPVSGILLILVARLTNKIDVENIENTAQVISNTIGSRTHSHNNLDKSIWKTITLFDVKGVILLVVSITSILLIFTSFHNGTIINNSSDKTKSDSIFNILSWPIILVIGVTSIFLFLVVERRNNVSPLIDLKLLAHRSILLSNILSISVGF